MAAKSALNLTVSADTSAARKSLQRLDAEVQKMQKNASRRNKNASKSDGGVVPGLPVGTGGKLPLPDVPGLEKVSGALSKMGGVAKMAGGNLGNLMLAAKGFAVGATAAFSAAKYVVDGMVAMTKAGAGAQANFEKINVALSTLSKNLGGSADVSQLATNIQLLAAEGVGNLDQLTAAARTLMVAFNGNTAAVQKWLPMMDDVAAGTSLTADQFAAMTARVQASGKIETEVLNMLRDRGVPVYKMLGEQAGVTGDEALKMAQKGQFGMTEWMSLVEKLHEKYKGLSAELSSNTLQGAIDTYTAMREMAFKGAAEARNLQEIADKNARAADYKLQAFDQVMQTNLKAAGEIVGKVGSFFDRLKDAVTPENIIAGAMNFLSDITGATETITQDLVTASLQFRQIPNFAGTSAKEIGQYLADAEKLYQQLDATLKNNSGISEETAGDMRAAMETIRDRMRVAQEAADEATKIETAEAERLAEAQREAARAAEEQAEAAKKEAAERERNIKRLEEERLANIKDTEKYRQELKEAEARREVTSEAASGAGFDFDVAVEKFAMAVSGMSLDDAIRNFEDLTAKIANANVNDITAEDKETHKRLEKMISEIARLRETAEKNSERKAAEEEEATKRARETTETESEAATRRATEELQEFAEALKQAGFSEEERNSRMALKLAEMTEAANEKLLHNLEAFNPNGDADASWADLLDAESAHAALANKLTEKQIKEAIKQNEIGQAMLAAIEKFNNTPTAQ